MTIARIKLGYNAFYKTLIDTEGAPDYGLPDGARVEVVEQDDEAVHVKYKSPVFGGVEAWMPKRFVIFAAQHSEAR